MTHQNSLKKYLPVIWKRYFQTRRNLAVNRLQKDQRKCLLLRRPLQVCIIYSSDQPFLISWPFFPPVIRGRWPKFVGTAASCFLWFQWNPESCYKTSSKDWHSTDYAPFRSGSNSVDHFINMPHIFAFAVASAPGAFQANRQPSNCQPNYSSLCLHSHCQSPTLSAAKCMSMALFVILFHYLVHLDVLF
jgi:hypothetical protein